jgi:hypothetical protein
MPEFFVKTQERGLQVEPLGAKSAYINGKICVQRQACWRNIGKSGHKYTYLSIHRPTGQFDICAWKLPDGRFLIQSNNLVGFTQTSFNREGSGSPGSASSAHDYREYLERWSLLEQPLSAE